MRSEGDGVDKSGQSIERMFSAVAPRYDLLNRLLSANLDRRWRLHLAGRSHSRPSVIEYVEPGQYIHEYRIAACRNELAHYRMNVQINQSQFQHNQVEQERNNKCY